MKLALQDTYARMDAALRVANAAGEFDFVGSTGIVVMVNHPAGDDEAAGFQQYLVCANVGDSRALL
jgi:serine/threonine protein phosphatase PrpC